MAAPGDVITNPSETPLPTATAPDDFTLPDDDPTAAATAPDDFTLPDDEPTATGTAPDDFTLPDNEPTATAPDDFTLPEDEPTATATAPDEVAVPDDEPSQPDGGGTGGSVGAAEVSGLPKAGSGPAASTDAARDAIVAFLAGGLVAAVGAVSLRTRMRD